MKTIAQRIRRGFDKHQGETELRDYAHSVKVLSESLEDVRIDLENTESDRVMFIASISTVITMMNFVSETLERLAEEDDRYIG